MLTTRWRHLIRHGLLGGSLVTVAASPASAERCDDVAPTTLGVVFGVELAQTARLVGGVEVRHCVAESEDLFARLELGADRSRLVLGARSRPLEAMTTEHEGEHLGIEAGAAFALDRIGLHFGGSYGTNTRYFAVQSLAPLLGTKPPMRMRVLAGFAPVTFGDDIDRTVEGRPLIADGALWRPALAAPLPHAHSLEDRIVRDHFTRAARYELSSVWTFLRLAAELAAVGAPPALVLRALDAADDEVRHAALCAHAAGGVALAALPMALARPRFTARSPHALAVLASEAWREGCLNEGAAAEEARLAADEARGPVGDMLATVARDELGHAELAWSVLAWVFSIAPELFDRAVPAPSQVASAPGTDANERTLAARGVPRRAVIDAARARSQAAARARWLDELAA